MSNFEEAWLAYAPADFLLDDARFRQSAPASDVLPHLPHLALYDAIASLTRSELDLLLKTRLLPMLNGTFASCGAPVHQIAERRGLKIVAEVPPEQFLVAVWQLWGIDLRKDAEQYLYKVSPGLSALYRFSSGQSIVGILVLGVCTAAMWRGKVEQLAYLGLLFTSVLFLAVISVRILVLLPYDRSAGKWKTELPDCKLPVYSVLVPLFKETKVLDQLLGALGDLDYPPDRLDIKIIVEQFDHATRRALADFVLPPHFEVIVVPAGQPQTKPRALNYGLMFARGELLTIYDAEDLPSPRQLRLCASVFANAPRRLACLQARLTIFNSNANWLTRQFALEYASLFGEILPGLASLDLPLPLGGTSNHFRVSSLRQVGGWDPHNVTEDADLGIRLARLGLSAATVDSDTLEEACESIRDWTRQRARWLKGFMQTWLVHMRRPIATYRQLGSFGFWVFQAVTLGVVVSALLHPAMMAYAVWHFWVIAGNPYSLLEPDTWVEGYGLMLLIAGYGTSIWIAVRTIRAQALPAFWSTILSLPVYWLLLTPAAWLAMWQFVTDLHGWNKTPHGKSRLIG